MGPPPQTAGVDPQFTDHRMESILAAYAEPVPRVIFATTPWEGGTAGLIEVFSDRRDLPYKLLRRPRSAAELA